MTICTIPCLHTRFSFLGFFVNQPTLPVQSVISQSDALFNQQSVLHCSKNLLITDNWKYQSYSSYFKIAASP